MSDPGALLQLSSPALPVGAYSYSQGLERAIEDGDVHDAHSAAVWIGDVLTLVLGRYEAPLWLRLRSAWDAGDGSRYARWNDEFIATRETRELRAETLQMGYSLRRLLCGLGHADPLPGEDLCYPAAHAWASACWAIAPLAALHGYLYGWAENQVMAAIKALPLGQLAGQRLLLALRTRIAATVVRAQALGDDALSTQAPLLALASSRHETQYSRLFRS